MRFKDIVLLVLPPIVWISIIYIASSQPYEQQDLRPMLRDLDLQIVERWFSWVSFTYSNTVVSIEARGVAGFVEFFIRKGAHVFVFAVLGLLLFRLLQLFKLSPFSKFVISLLIIVIFAVIDEYRHFHHPNRTGLIEDVILDTIGGLIGIVLALLMIKRRQSG